MAKQLSQRERKFFSDEGKTLDTLYKSRMEEWQRLVDLYNNKFTEQIRDLSQSEVIRIPRFFPLVRQIIATVAFNYPKLYFTIEDDDGEGIAISDIMERASSSLLRLTHTKEHVHQAIFDALVTGVGWLRIDYNPPGDDMIPPYTTNDVLAEDLPSISRMPPGHVHLDPLTSPHMLGTARYIRELMWVPLKQLRDDPEIKNKNQIKASALTAKEELGFGETMNRSSSDPEEEAIRSAIDAGDFVLVERWHDRINSRLIMFADGMDQEILVRPHPFVKMVFPERFNMMGQPILDEEDQPIFDLENGEEAPGWLVEQGFSFVPIKFDISAQSFYPTSQLQYLEDIQLGIIESMSRQSALLKRTARQGIVQMSEDDDTVDQVRSGEDGQWTKVNDINNWRELHYGSVPGEQYAFEDRLRSYEQEATQVNDFSSGGSAGARTATEAGLLAAVADVNREWMETAVAKTYEVIVRNSFQIMGDPRYEPENFQVNVAPNGQNRLSRALRNADFLWNYRIFVQAGSTRPLFEQFQRQQAVDFYDRAIHSPNFDRMELDKFLASAYEVADPEKILKDTENEDAQRASMLENDWMITKAQDIQVESGQDHQAHIRNHGQYRAHPQYQELIRSAQAVDVNQVPVNPQAAQRIQAIDQLVNGHIASHQQVLEQEQSNIATPPSGEPMGSLQSRVLSNAQDIYNQVSSDTRDIIG